MTNFYKTLKREADKSVSKLFSRIVELREQISKAKKKLQKETAIAANLNKRISALRETAGEQIAESESSYLKFKTSMKKLSVELEASGEVIEALQSDYIPKLEDKLTKAHHDKLTALTRAAISCRHIGVTATETIAREVSQVFERLIAEHLSFQSAWVRIYKELDEDFLNMFGASYNIPDILPLGLTNDNIKYVRWLLLTSSQKTAALHPVEEPSAKEKVEPENKIVGTVLSKRPPDEGVAATKDAEWPPKEKPAAPLYRKECAGCLEEFRTADGDVIRCPGCQEKEAARLLEAEEAEPVTLEPAAIPTEQAGRIKPFEETNS